MLRYDWPVCVLGLSLAKMVVKNGQTEEEKDVMLCRIGKEHNRIALGSQCGHWRPKEYVVKYYSMVVQSKK